MMNAATRHMFRSQRLSVALLLWSFVLGAGAGASRPQPPDLRMDGYPVAGTPAVVTVLALGAEPRIPLRYTVPDTYKDHMSMSMLMSVSVDMAGTALPAMQMPRIKMGADLHVTSVSASGDISYDLAFSGFDVESAPGVDPTMSAAFKGIDADYKTLKGTSTISNRGIPRSWSLDFSRVSNPQLKQTLDSVWSTLQSLSMPLPEEAVGVGARWEVHQAIANRGIQIFQKSVFEVVALSGKTVTLKITIEQSAPPQAVTNPALPAGTEVRLQELTGAGSATITLHLDMLVPTSEATMESNTVMQISMGGDTKTMTTAVTIKIGTSSVK